MMYNPLQTLNKTNSIHIVHHDYLLSKHKVLKLKDSVSDEILSGESKGSVSVGNKMPQN